MRAGPLADFLWRLFDTAKKPLAKWMNSQREFIHTIAATYSRWCLFAIYQLFFFRGTFNFNNYLKLSEQYAEDLSFCVLEKQASCLSIEIKSLVANSQSRAIAAKVVLYFLQHYFPIARQAVITQDRERWRKWLFAIHGIQHEARLICCDHHSDSKWQIPLFHFLTFPSPPYWLTESVHVPVVISFPCLVLPPVIYFTEL